MKYYVNVHTVRVSVHVYMFFCITQKRCFTVLIACGAVILIQNGKQAYKRNVKIDFFASGKWLILLTFSRDFVNFVKFS